MGQSFISKHEDKSSETGRPQPKSKKPVDLSDEDCVIRKLKKGNRQAQNMPEEELKEWARSLCMGNELKEWYLNPEFATTVEQFEKLEKVNATAVKASSGNTGGGGVFSSTSESQESRPQSENGESFNLDDIDFDLEDIRKDAAKPFMQIGKRIKIKLIIAEICKSDTQKALRKMLSPILTKLDYQQQFGMFHSALVIGPWYLEWNNSSLCIPRKCYSSAAMIAADLEYKGISTFDLDTTIEKISKVIIDWNVNKEYDQHKANCQQFVDDIIRALEVPIQFEGVLGEYLDNLRTKGVCEIFFPVSDNMKEEFGIKESKVYFHTHAELDKFVKDLLDKNPMFEQDHNEDWNLLKSFDRAFWLRHFRHDKDPTYQPHGGSSEGCPFGDPSVTASFKKEWF